MARRAPNLSEWATEVLARISAVATKVETLRADAANGEQELYTLIEEAMHYGVTSAQILKVTKLFSSSRLYQIKHRQYSESRGGGEPGWDEDEPGGEGICLHLAVYGPGSREGQCTRCGKRT